MGSISIPVYEFLYSYGAEIVAGAAVAASTGASMYASHQAGVAQANQDKQKARVEALNEQNKQISIRQNMIRALASQNASTVGAVGTGANSGFGANARRQITQEQNDLLVSGANSSAQVSLLDQAAGNARAQGNIQGVADLTGGVAKLAGL